MAFSSQLVTEVIGQNGHFQCMQRSVGSHKVKGPVREKLWETRGLTGAVGGWHKGRDSGQYNELAPRHRSLVME